MYVRNEIKNKMNLFNFQSCMQPISQLAVKIVTSFNPVPKILSCFR